MMSLGDEIGEKTAFEFLAKLVGGQFFANSSPQAVAFSCSRLPLSDGTNAGSLGRLSQHSCGELQGYLKRWIALLRGANALWRSSG
jgi:hypothetical protein